MPVNIPTVKQTKEKCISTFESKLNQTTPLNDKAFIRVLSAILAMLHKELYNYGRERAAQNLALTASENGLDINGHEYGVIRKTAESTVLIISLPATDGTVIPANIDFVADSTKVRYYPDSSVTASGGVALITVTAENPGVIGNLNISDTLTIGTVIPGAESTATVITIVNTGAEEEVDEVYRSRVLLAKRITTGGGNKADHKIWAEEVAGVSYAFPYSGLPYGDAGTSVPGDRTVYIQADTSIDPDGIAPQSLRDEVETSLTYDFVNNVSRPPMGLDDSNLYVRSISRIELFVKITNMNFLPELETEIKSAIADALTKYFSSIKMYVDGIDIPEERNDKITKLTIATVVQAVLNSYGASAEQVVFGDDAPVTTPLANYLLNPGELAKFGGVDYA